MLNWLFKKRGTVNASKASPALRPMVPQPQADARAKQAEDAWALWGPRLEAAQGDDAALRLVAQAAPVLEIKLAAVEALITEDGLKRAERELRSGDRRVHRAAKRRLEATVAQREARARAQTLIESATALAGVALVPANRLVELDRAWQALDERLLEPARCTEFSELRERLNAAMRERGEAQQQLQRWTADATRALAELQLGCAAAADHGTGNGGGNDFALRSATARALRDARPDVPATAGLGQALQAALQTATLVEARLAWLVALEHPATELAPASAPVADPADVANPEAAETHAGDILPTAPVEIQSAPRAPTAAQRWRALPPLADGALARALDERFEQWQRRQAPARLPATASRAAPAVAKVASTEQLLRLDALMQQAEAALAEGRLGEMQQHLQAVDAALEAINGVVSDDTLRARHQVLQAELARLKGWQEWGGGRARDGLMAEAEDLARLTLACADPDANNAPKLHLKAHGDAIHALRTRWKELDRLGAVASQALWQRFDAAVRTAHQPVAAQQAALKAARQDNLSAREALLAALEVAPVQAASTDADDLAAYWKEQLRALDRFKLAWRQLGPLEHTVPAAARSALQQRLRSSVERIEAPLQEARRVAEAAREQLIVRAEALVQEVGLQAEMRDAAPQVRELQAEWQQHARTLPLARAVESALWARFRAAVDAVFAQRDAASGARDAESAAHLAAREALLERLSALAGNTPVPPVAEIQRTLAEVDRAWHQAIELPRGAAGAVDARFRAARAAVLRALNAGAQERWQAQCDTLAAKLALCEEREGASTDAADVARRWAACNALPAAWEQALAQRGSRPAEPGRLAEPAFDELLLQLEAALDLPAAPEWRAARRDLKLRAMKDALEGRASQNLDPARQADWLAAALRQSDTAAAQRERLHALMAALRQAPPGALGSPMPRG